MFCGIHSNSPMFSRDYIIVSFQKWAWPIVSFCCILGYSTCKPVPLEHSQAMLTYELSSQKIFSSDEPLLIRFTLSNPYDYPVYVLGWFTPLEGLMSDILEVKHKDGEYHLPYRGLMMKRGHPTTEDYQRIEAANAISQTFDLSEGYDVQDFGTYQITLKNTSFELIPAQLFETIPQGEKVPEGIKEFVSGTGKTLVFTVTSG